MKNLISITSTLSLLIILHSGLDAQTTAIWQGGTPGRTTQWDCPSNWEEGRTPDEFSLVIIPSDSHFYPVIESVTDPIDALLVETGAEVTIQDRAELIVLGETGRMDGMILFGTIINQGALDLRYDSGTHMAALKQIKGSGKLYCGFDEALVSSRAW